MTTGSSSGGQSGPPSPCAACKFLRRRCTRDCIFAPHFPPNQPRKFALVHKFFGASNVSKLLSDVQEHQRDDTVTSLVFEAEAIDRNYLYGCLTDITLVHNRVIRLQQHVSAARASQINRSPNPMFPYGPPNAM